MKRLFVYSGGGAPGIDIHAGTTAALFDRGIRPDAISGTSAGACYGALIAHHMDADAVADIVYSINDRDFRDSRFLWKLRFSYISHFMNNGRLERLINELLPLNFEDLKVHLQTWAVNRHTGVCHPFFAGNLRRAVLASMSIRGIFPPVMWNGSRYSDGGTKMNVPLPDEWSSYDEVYVIIATQPVNYEKRDSGIIRELLLNVHELMENQVEDVIASVRGNPKVRFIRPDVHSPMGTLHFDHRLIADAYDETNRILDRNT